MIAEDLLLLAYADEARGPVGGVSQLEHALVGALLVELVIRERVDVTTVGAEGESGRVSVRDDTPTKVAPLDDALARLSTLEGAKPKDVLRSLAGAGLAERLLTGLVERGLLRKEHGHVLGLAPAPCWPAEDSRHEEGVKDQLRRVLVDGEYPDERTAVLIALLAHGTALRHVAGREHADVADRRAKEIAQGSWAGDSLRKSVEEIVTATLLAPTILLASSTAFVRRW